MSIAPLCLSQSTHRDALPQNPAKQAVGCLAAAWRPQRTPAFRRLAATLFCGFSVLRSFAACAAKPKRPYAYSALPAAELFFSLYHGKQEIPPVLAGFYRNFIFCRPGRAAAAAALYLAGRYDTIRDEASGPLPAAGVPPAVQQGPAQTKKGSASPYAI